MYVESSSDSRAAGTFVGSAQPCPKIQICRQPTMQHLLFEECPFCGHLGTEYGHALRPDSRTIHCPNGACANQLQCRERCGTMPADGGSARPEGHSRRFRAVRLKKLYKKK